MSHVFSLQIDKRSRENSISIEIRVSFRLAAATPKNCHTLGGTVTVSLARH